MTGRVKEVLLKRLLLGYIPCWARRTFFSPKPNHICTQRYIRNILDC